MARATGLIFFCLLFGYGQQDGARYLIVCADEYYDELQPFAEWKTDKGVAAKIVKVSEIGFDSTEIRAYVRGAYLTWPIRPEYLLLVGSPSQIPFPNFHYDYNLSQSDNYYTDVAGDFRNEIIPGRWWVFDETQVKTIVNKVLGYEKTPYMFDPSWFRKGTTIVNEDDYPPYSDSVYFADAAYAQQMMAGALFTEIDSFSQYAGNNTLIDVINAWNDGRAYILYRGVGAFCWDYPFDTITADALVNGFKLPVIVSATCATVEGIGYYWLNAGSPEVPKGSVGFFGTTDLLMAAAEMRSALATGTVAAIFSDSFATLGKAAEAGRLEYCRQFGNSQEYNSWTCLGDPEMTLWTATPRALTVEHWPPCWMGESLVVTVKHNALPVESALVCVRSRSDSAIYAYRRTDGAGKVTFDGSLTAGDTALITVTGRNLLPGRDTVVGGHSGGPFLTYGSHAILDTAAGNGNYQANNGEEIEVPVWVLNFGDSIARGVTAVLQKAAADGFFELADTVKFLGDIGPVDSGYTSADGFNVTIDQYCPDSHYISLRLVMTTVDSVVWTSYFGFLVYSPRPYIIYMKNIVLDTAGGNGDYRINPAETIELPVWAGNIGDSLAEGVFGVIRKDTVDEYFDLADTVKYFGFILPGDSAWTGGDGFDLAVDTNCPDGHEFKLALALSDTLDSLWVYRFTLENHAPVIDGLSYQVNDSLKYLDRGSTASLHFTIKNEGTQPADSVFGSLSSADSFITVVKGTACFGTILPESTATNARDSFVIRADSQAPYGYRTTLKLAVTAGVYAETLDCLIFIGQLDYVVWDPDPNHTSGFVIHSRLAALGYSGDYAPSFPTDFLNIYRSVFICVGISPEKFVVRDTSPVIPELVQYLDRNFPIYLEGGDVWFFDPLYNHGYNFGPHFSITAISNGVGNFTNVLGVAGTFTDGMNFGYSGEENSLDRINPAGSGVAVFKNAFNNYNCGVAADHRRVGVSFEFGGLIDGQPHSTKLVLADSIMRYFGVLPQQGISGRVPLDYRLVRGFAVFPNPAFNQVQILYNFTGDEPRERRIRVRIYDTAGRVVKEYRHRTAKPSDTVIWPGTDDRGRRLPAGVYFIRCEDGDSGAMKKVVLLR